MRREHIDRTDLVWRIPLTKTGIPHEVPITNSMLDIIDSTPRFEGEYVFTSTEGEKPVHVSSRAKKQLDTLAAVSDWQIRDLRRTVRTYLAQIGVPESIGERILSHAQGKSRGVSAVYDRHSYMPEKRDALEKWHSCLRGILENRVVPLTRGSDAG